ncbi:3'-5' exonuclease [Pseudonocardia sp. MH-G8]|uniref:3'-5' exonuclease n=1 Tax=Pseudonocardia sp. MH-G8 TaxID=1854588 RepID=UPI000B9FC496|nr:3'-5' exonuclease [Pseudonocardia sp. MH-G8]OZM76591.1 DNA polymerase III subunit epsilon [Pseudonocardia sp. MH-G8]
MSEVPGLAFPWRADITGRDVVVVDVEGNGQQPPEIVEIAILSLGSNRDVSTSDLRTWLVRPTRPITGLVTGRVHGITNADVAIAPRWTDIATEVAAVLGDRVVIAHNATVERRVLADHLPSWRPPLMLDTLRLAKTVWPALPGGYGLDNLIRHAALTPPNITGALGAASTQGRRHRAGYDTWMTAALLITLVRGGGLTWDQLLTAACLPDPAPPQPPGTSGSAGAAGQSGNGETEGLW